MTGLLDGGYIRDLFGSVFSSIYGDGRYVRIEMVRQSSGSIFPVVQEIVPIKIQVDVCTEAMRQAQGYTSSDVRLFVLQQDVFPREPSTDDLFIGQGKRWKLYNVTQDPARSYWEGRGVKQATTNVLTLDWVLEYGMWDDAGLWRNDAPWQVPVGTPALASIVPNMTKNNVALAIAAAIGEVPSSWLDAFNKLNVIAGASSLPLLANGDKGNIVRGKINAITEEVS